MFSSKNRNRGRLLFPRRTPVDQTQSAKIIERSWEKIASQLKHNPYSMPEPTKHSWQGLRSLYQLYPTYVWGSGAVIAGLAGILAFSVIHKSTTTLVATSATPQVVFLPADSSHYFYPATPSPTAATTPAATDAASAAPTASAVPASPTPAATTTSPVALQFALNTKLYDYNKPNDNMSLGVRNNSGVAENFFGISVAKAADPYPAVYYSKFWDPRSPIIEINAFTGQESEVFHDDGVIQSISYNNQRQTLAYTMDTADSKPSVRTYNFETKTKTLFWSGTQVGQASNVNWSPDGSLFYAISPDQKLLVVNPDSMQLSTYPLPADIDTWNMQWDDTSKHITGIVRTSGQTPKAVIFDVQTGTFTTVSDQISHFDNINWLRLVNNTLIFRTSDPAFTSEFKTQDGKLMPASQGWLGIFDLTSHTGTEYRAETGDYMNSPAEISADGNKFVFIERTQTDGSYLIRSFNKTTDQVIETPLPKINGSYIFTILGWNGNEDNILLTHSNSTTFYNVNVVTKEVTQLTP